MVIREVSAFISMPQLDHYLPQLYLRRFANDRDQVRVVRIGEPEISTPVGIANIAAERGFYEIDEDYGVPSRLVDDMLTKVESATAEALGVLDTSGLPLSDTWRLNIALYLAAQALRTPFARSMIEQHREFKVRRQAVHTIQDQQSDESLAEGDQELLELYEALPNLSLSFDNYLHTREIGLQIIPRTRWFLEKGWRLRRADGQVLVTSDNPIVSSPWAPSHDFIFPLDAQTILELRSRDEEDDSDVIRLGRRQIREVNRRMIDGAYKLLIHHPERDPLRGLRIPKVVKPLIYVEDIPVHEHTDLADLHEEFLKRQAENSV